MFDKFVPDVFYDKLFSPLSKDNHKMVDILDTSHIFISHSSDDSKFVTRLAKDLEQVGIPIWVDHQKLKPSTRNWEKAIREALHKSRALIYVATPTAAESDFVQDELSIAEMEGCTLLAVWADGIDGRWLDCTPLGYGKLQHADMREDKYEEGLKELLEALNHVPTKRIFVSPTHPENDSPSVPVATKNTTALRNPYKALNAFTEADAADFFGRDSLTSDLFKRLVEFPSFLAVIGASGAGKSSVVMAGLIPKLRKDFPDWVFLKPIKPAGHPVEALATMLQSQIFRESSIRAVREDLESPDSRGLIVRSNSISRKSERSRIVLVIDQFEELFTQTTDDVERDMFINLLTSAVADLSCKLTIIITLRADFFDRLLINSDLALLIREYSEPILPMSITDLKQVIEEPARRNGLTFEDGLVAELVFDARGQVGGLPLLQFTLDQLFQRRSEAILTWGTYHLIGGLKGALKSHAETTYTQLLDDEHRRLARALFLRLIEPGQSDQDATRRRMPQHELNVSQADKMKFVADTFVSARLLTAEVDTIEVSHEALIREWPRLNEWLRENRDDIRLQKDIANDTANWLRNERDKSRLYSGAKLDEASHWSGRNIPAVDEILFIQAGMEEREQSQKAESERQKRELKLAQELTIAAKRAEDAEKARAIRFEQAARRATIRARIAALIAGVATIGVLLAVIATAEAIGQTTNASAQLATVTIAQGQAVATRNDAIRLAAQANATLTPISATLNYVAYNLNYAQEQQATLQYNATVSTFDQERLATLVPIIAQVPPTSVYPLSYSQKLATATAIATAYSWKPAIAKDEKNVEIVLVPSGCFLMGVAGLTDTQPVSEICFQNPYWIDQYEVTNWQFSAFVKAGDGYLNDKNWTEAGVEWRTKNNRTGHSDQCSTLFSADNKPVVCVNWYESYAYCQWRGSRLPNEAEWEYAARGPASFIYSWGNSFVPDNAVFSDTSRQQTEYIGSRPNGISWVGAYDFSGNVWEWTLTADAEYDMEFKTMARGFRYPYNSNDGRNDVNGYHTRVVRGGSWRDSASSMRAAIRGWNIQSFQENNIGFRCMHPS